MPWVIVQDLFYTVWAEDDFFYTPESSAWAFYFVNPTVWAEDDFFYIPDLIDWGADFQRFYFPEEFWLLPLDIEFDHVKGTGNPEELVVLPESLAIVPEQIEFRRTDWEREEDSDESNSWRTRNT